MCPTLFTIPNTEFWGLPLFGFGWVLIAWCLIAAVVIGLELRRLGWTAAAFSSVPVLAITGLAIAYLLPILAGNEGIHVRSWGTMLLVAIVSSVGLAAYRARRLGLDPELILSLAMWLVIAGILGARVFYVIEYWNTKFRQDTLAQTIAAIFNVTQGGMVVYGSLLAGGLALVLFVRKHHLPALALSDLVAPSVVLGMAIGRFGCLLNGCCFGGLTDLPWGLTFPWRSPAYLQQVELGQIGIHGLHLKAEDGRPPVIASVDPDSPAALAGLEPGQHLLDINSVPVDTIEAAQRGFKTGYVPASTVEAAELLLVDIPAGGKATIRVAEDPNQKTMTVPQALPRSRPVHPAQIYSFIDALLLCLFLLAYYPFRTRDGEVTALTLTLHPISRFLLEIIRVDESAVFSTPWSISQNISLLLLAGAVVTWIYVLQKPRGTAWPKWEPTHTPTPLPLGEAG